VETGQRGVGTEKSVRSEITKVPTICGIMVATTMNSLFVALFALVASSFRTRAALTGNLRASPLFRFRCVPKDRRYSSLPILRLFIVARNRSASLYVQPTAPTAGQKPCPIGLQRKHHKRIFHRVVPPACVKRIAEPVLKLCGSLLRFLQPQDESPIFPSESSPRHTTGRYVRPNASPEAAKASNPRPARRLIRFFPLLVLHSFERSDVALCGPAKIAVQSVNLHGLVRATLRGHSPARMFETVAYL
jgi:hypothetical protein